MGYRGFLILILTILLATTAVGYQGPFITDAEIIAYISDTEGIIESNQRMASFFYPGITGLLIDGRPASIIHRGANCIEVFILRGRHKAVIQADSKTALTQYSRKPLSRHGSTLTVSSAEELESAAGTIKPGDIITISNGIYHDFKANISFSGTQSDPIVIIPEQIGGVVFRRLTNINIRGDWIIFKGFLFEHCDIRALKIDGGDHCRITQCRFFHCGSSTSTFPHICSIDMDSHYNRIDHCYFTGSKCMSLGQRNSVNSGRPAGTHNRIDHNIFRDIWRYWINGQENIQLGQGAGSDRRLYATVEYNLFDNAWGDSEIFSNKTSSNTYRHNVAAWCPRSSMTLRGGNDVIADGNIIVGADSGFRVFGTGHRIINNIVCLCERGVLLFPHLQGDAPADCLIANNTFYNNSGGIDYKEMTDDIRNIRIVNNIFSGGKGVFINPGLERCCDIEYNLFNPCGQAETGCKGIRPVIAEPLLNGSYRNLSIERKSPVINEGVRLESVDHDIHGTRRPQGSRYDIGAIEYVFIPNRSPDELIMPPVPYKRDNTEGFMKGDEIFSLNETINIHDSTIRQLERLVLPESFSLRGYYHPRDFDSRISIDFSGTGILDGYRIDIGGSENNKPRGYLELFKNKQFIARGCDTVLYLRDYQKSNSWPGRDYGIEIAKPNPQLWYHIRLIKYRNSIKLILNKPKLKASGDPGNTWDVPVLIWEDIGKIAGEICNGDKISVTQNGWGTWKNLVIEKLE